jgi:hypothetical protein
LKEREKDSATDSFRVFIPLPTGGGEGKKISKERYARRARRCEYLSYSLLTV